MTDQTRNPVERALDLFFYAPLGLVLEAPTLLPKLVERGRQQATMARVVGQFAVQQGQGEATKAVSAAQQTATKALQDLGVLPRSAPDAPAASAPAPAAPATPPPSVPSTAPAPSAAAAPKAPPAGGISTVASGDGQRQRRTGPDLRPPLPSAHPAGAPAGAAVDVDTLAIPGYDTLSASQVVPRLASLSSDELEAVRRYEAATRGRKTILNRVAQLQSS